LNGTKAIVDQFDVVPFKCYKPNDSIISLSEPLYLLLSNNFNISKTLQYLNENNKKFSDRRFAVNSIWKKEEVHGFEAVMRRFETFEDRDLNYVQEKIPTKTIYEINRFHWAWKSSKRFKKWQDELKSSFPNFLLEKGRAIPILRNIARVDYSDASLFSNLPMKCKFSNLSLMKEDIIKTSNCNDGDAFEVFIHADIYDIEEDRKKCEEYITKRNIKTDYFLFPFFTSGDLKKLKRSHRKHVTYISDDDDDDID